MRFAQLCLGPAALTGVTARQDEPVERGVVPTVVNRGFEQEPLAVMASEPELDSPVVTSGGRGEARGDPLEVVGMDHGRQGSADVGGRGSAEDWVRRRAQVEDVASAPTTAPKSSVSRKSVCARASVRRSGRLTSSSSRRVRRSWIQSTRAVAAAPAHNPPTSISSAVPIAVGVSTGSREASRPSWAAPLLSRGRR